MKGKILKSIIILGAIIVVFFVFFGRTLPSINLNTNQNLAPIKKLSISDKIFYRQTLNNCAAYSAMAAINIVQQREIDPELLAQETKWRIQKNLTFPQGLIDILHKYNIKTSEFNLYAVSDNQKINWIKNTLSEGKPIILLVKVGHIQHYFIVVGFDTSGFMLYDSLQDKQKNNPSYTIIDRPDYSGNRFYSYEKVLHFWNEGGYMVFFNNWAVVCG